MTQERGKCFFCGEKDNNLFSFHQEHLNEFNEKNLQKEEELKKREQELNQQAGELRNSIQQVEQYTKLTSPEFIEIIKKVRKEWDDHRWFNEDRVFEYIYDFFAKEEKNVSKHERKFKIVLEEVKRMLITLYYISDCLEGTHADKNKVKYTLDKVIQKQVSFFDKMSTEEYYVREYFESADHYNSLVTYFELQDENKKKDQTIKQLEADVKYYKEKSYHKEEN